MLLIQFHMWLMTFWQETIPIPTDISIWQGLKLSLIFNILIGFLRIINVIKDGPLKKSIGYILMAVGAIVGGTYAITAQGVDDFIPLMEYIGGGALSGVMAVGAHSTVKNGKEAWPQVVQLVIGLFKGKSK